MNVYQSLTPDAPIAFWPFNFSIATFALSADVNVFRAIFMLLFQQFYILHYRLKFRVALRFHRAEYLKQRARPGNTQGDKPQSSS